MFNLEQAIVEWRQKMLAAGIETPVPLEELELHLREEIERQMGKGLAAEKAFERAVQCVGEARPLHKEFRKSGTLGRSRSQIYNRALAAFALYVVLLTMMAVRDPSGGPITTSWVTTLENFVVLPPVFYQESPGWSVFWLNLLNYTYSAAMLAALIARRYQPGYGSQLSRLLNWALLLALPWGPLIGLYGLWCSEAEKADGAPKSWLGKFFVFAMTPVTDRSVTITKRLLAASLQVTRATVLFLYGLWGILEIYVSLGFMAAIGGTTVGLIFMVTFLLVNVWLTWFVWQIFRGQKPQPKASPAYV
jgi:hypothetical protein